MLNLKQPPLYFKIIILVAIVLVFTGGDLLVKELAARTLRHRPDVTVIPGFWSFHYTENKDIGFSMLRFLDSFFSRQGKFILIVSLQLAGTFVAIGFFFHLKRWKYCLPLALIISGGLGNVLDRIIRGYVVDYVKWYIGSFVWPIFNLADTYTVVGAFTLGVILFFFSKDLNEPEKNLPVENTPPAEPPLSE